VRDHFGCPVQATINVVSGKWKIVTIWHLGFSARRFAALRDLLPGISDKVLASQLRQMEADGIVKREVAHASPPQVTYSLTRAGEELIGPLGGLCAWGTEHLSVPPNLKRYPKRTVKRKR
jgi:DNA-binding HxlR family transcriptional regulator